MCAKPRPKTKAKAEAKTNPSDDLFGSIPSMPEFNAFPDDIISQLTGKQGAATAPGEPGGTTKEEPAAPAPVPQTDPPVKKDSRIQQSKSTTQSPRAAKRGARKAKSASGPKKAIPQGSAGKTQQAEAVIQQAEPTVPGGDAACPDMIGSLPPIRTRNQVALRKYLLAYGDHVTTYQIISRQTGVPVGTIRDVFRKFEALGLIAKRKVVKPGGVQGMRLTVMPGLASRQVISTVGKNRGKVSALSRNVVNTKAKQSASTVQSTVESGQLETSVGSKVRQRLLALGDDDLAFFYPNLAGIGFTRLTLARMVENLDKIGKSDKNLAQALEYADWEIGRGDGEPTLERVFAEVSRTGCYPRPQGYVPPEVQAELDRQKDERAIARARSTDADA